MKTLEQTISQHETRLAATENARRHDPMAVDKWPESADRPALIVTPDTAISVNLQDTQEQQNTHEAAAAAEEEKQQHQKQQEAPPHRPDHDVSIETVRQQMLESSVEAADTEGESGARLVVVTHTAPEAALSATVDALAELSVVRGVTSVMRVEGL